MMKKNIFMFLYGPIETDGRVLRAIKAINELPVDIILVSCGSKEDFNVNDVAHHYNYKKKKYFTFLCYILQVFILSIKLRKRIDIFYLHDYYSTFFAFFVRMLNKPYIYDAHELIVKRKAEKKSLRDRFFMASEALNIKHAKCVIEANKERERVIRYIYRLTNTTHVLNIAENSTITLNANPNKILVYQGALSEGRNLDFFIYAIKEINPEYKLLFIGDGPAKHRLESLAESLQLNNRVVFAGKMANAQMMNLLHTCMIGIISYPFDSINNIFCAPNKVFEYASMSLPMISTNQPFLQDVLHKYNIGETFVFNSTDSFVNAFTIISSNYNKYRIMMKAFLKEYSWSNEKEKIKSCITDIQL